MNPPSTCARARWARRLSLLGVFLATCLIATVAGLILWQPPLPADTDAAIERSLTGPLPELITGRTGFVHSRGAAIWYECLEPPGEPKGTVLLIMGIAADALVWPPGLVGALVDDGYRVIRHDHRGTGLSDWHRRTDQGSHYTLTDMAADGVAILDTLNVDQAHVVGLSMGGMVAQELALLYPERVKTLSLLMTTGNPLDPELPVISPAPGLALTALWFKHALLGSEKGQIRYQLAAHVLLAGQAEHDIDLDYTVTQVLYNLRQRRGYNRWAPRHHLSAIRRSGSRLERLPELNMPTLVLHGTLDPLIPVAHGERLVELIPGARGVWLEGLGHDIPPNRAVEVAGVLLEHFAHWSR